MGWRISLMGLEVSPERFPQADHVFHHLDFSKMAVTPHTYIVVASHGNYDEDMLVAALQSPAPYVALIASKKRSSAILQYLNEAGLDFGGVTPEEIALSILAEIVQRRQSPISNSLISGSPASLSTLELPMVSDPPTDALDPVCGMAVEIATAHFTSEYAGTTYYFCAAGCKRSFDKEPKKYIQPESSQM
jgi:xanthine dehydrogenase accessory factor